MIEALILYLVSIVISAVEDKINYYRALYEINKEGTYVIPNMFNVAYKTTYATSLLEKLIPIYNILKPLYVNMRIPQTIDIVYSILSDADVLEIMEPEAKRELMENPSLAKAKELSDRHEKEINNYSIMSFNDYSIVFFDAKDTGITKIKRVMGPLSHEDGFTQFNRLSNGIELYKIFLDVIYKNSLSEEEMNDLLSKQFTFSLKNIDDSIDHEEFRKGLQEMYDLVSTQKQIEKDTKTLKRIRKK